MDRQGGNGLPSHPVATEWCSGESKGEGDLESEGLPSSVGHTLALSVASMLIRKKTLEKNKKGKKKPKQQQFSG